MNDKSSESITTDQNKSETPTETSSAITEVNSPEKNVDIAENETDSLIDKNHTVNEDENGGNSEANEELTIDNKVEMNGTTMIEDDSRITEKDNMDISERSDNNIHTKL